MQGLRQGASAHWTTRLIAPSFVGLVVLSPLGYGQVYWALHPTLVLLGIALMFEAVKLGHISRTLHSTLAIVGSAFLFAGCFLAWSVHESKGESHFALGKSLVKRAHVWGAWVLLAVTAVQLLSGSVRMWCVARVPAFMRVKLASHSWMGRSLTTALVVLTSLGLWLMLVEKARKVDPSMSGTMVAVRGAVWLATSAACVWHAKTTVWFSMYEGSESGEADGHPYGSATNGARNGGHGLLPMPITTR